MNRDAVAEVFPEVVFEIAGLPVRDTVVVTWALMAAIILLALVGGRRLRDRPLPLQNALEATIEALEKLVVEIVPFDPGIFLPFVGTLGVYLFACTAVGQIPGVGAPTRDLSTTAALALVVFVSVHVYGIRLLGVRRFLRTYLEPSWLLLPFNLIAEVTRTLALALRLFGNMLSGELIVAILLLLVPLFVPILMQALGLLLGIIQAYVFTLLATVYIAAALRPTPPKNPPPSVSTASGPEESIP